MAVIIDEKESQLEIIRGENRLTINTFINRIHSIEYTDDTGMINKGICIKINTLVKKNKFTYDVYYLGINREEAKADYAMLKQIMLKQ